MAVGLAWPATAAAARLEYEVKAAFLYNFAKFVEWPEGAFPGTKDPLMLCVVGDEDFAKSVAETVKGRTVHGRSLLVHYVDDPSVLDGCHLLFVGQVENDDLARILHSIDGSSVLTVSEASGFVDDGGIIRLFVAEGKVRFEINAGAAEQARLKVSSQLLKLARAVRR